MTRHGFSVVETTLPEGGTVDEYRRARRDRTRTPAAKRAAVARRLARRNKRQETA